MLLMIDNYDSFTYNLVQYFGELGAKQNIFRNDEITIDKIKALKPDRIVISPGPGRPEKAGISVDVIKEFAGQVPILGVCLGHQCMGYAYGAKIIRAKKLMHGKTSMIKHNSNALFKSIDYAFEATRYHSLIIDKTTLPKCFDVIAWTSDREIMAIAHKTYPMWGVQFHPESILTLAGKSMLNNFLKLK